MQSDKQAAKKRVRAIPMNWDRPFWQPTSRRINRRHSPDMESGEVFPDAETSAQKNVEAA